VSFPPVSELIPHQGPARWLSQILAFEPPCLTAVGQLPAWAGVGSDPAGEAPTSLGLELIAQAAAAYGALAEPAQAGREGFLVSIARMELHRARVPTLSELGVELRERSRVGRASSFWGRLSHGNEALLECEFLVVEAVPRAPSA
jgi:predicted hotdog family 3-hydroxylacyl-ACP dehydratase